MSAIGNQTDRERIEKCITKLADFMDECGLEFPYGYSRSTWEVWSELKVMNFHKVVGLNLDLLEQCDLGSLAHDIGGICSRWNTVTESMDDCFLPRCTERRG